MLLFELLPPLRLLELALLLFELLPLLRLLELLLLLLLVELLLLCRLLLLLELLLLLLLLLLELPLLLSPPPLSWADTIDTAIAEGSNEVARTSVPSRFINLFVFMLPPCAPPNQRS